MPDFPNRILRFQVELQAEGAAGAVLAPTDQMRYLTGWAESGHERLLALFIPAEGEPTFVTPEINRAQALHNSAGITSARGWRDEGGWAQVVGPLLEEWRSGPILIDDELQSAHLLGIQALSPRHDYLVASAILGRLREVKSEDELGLLRASAALTDKVYAEVVETLHAGMTERELAANVAAAYSGHGVKPEFAIVCFGANGAHPHHHSGDTRLTVGDVVIMDIGCLLHGYGSDITRTVGFGTPDAEAFNVYDVVARAQRSATDRVKPGTACEDVDAAARQVISDAGFGEYFTHRTGHGIGMSGHEAPYIVGGNKAPLKQGMCFSIEPGVYLPGRFGVRLENIVTVSASGAESLNAEIDAKLRVVRA